MNRIGLGCSGMARRNEESSIRTVDTALDHGVTMFNVAELRKVESKTKGSYLNNLFLV